VRTFLDGDRLHRLGSVGEPMDEGSSPWTLSPEEASRLLGRLARDPLHATGLRLLLAQITGASGLFQRDTAEVVAALARLCVARRLVVVSRPLPALRAWDGDGEDESEPISLPPPSVREEPAAEKTWIEIELLDEKGKPVVGERYRIKLTDGSTYHGQLDRMGRARYTGLDPGQCAVWFPALHGKRWTLAGREGEEDEVPESEPRRGERKTWVEIELLDDDGRPAAGEVYEIELPDGTVFRGNLDEEGTAFHGDIDPGSCKITFPRLGAREWEEARS
jgi:hypothetical protein